MSLTRSRAPSAPSHTLARLTNLPERIRQHMNDIRRQTMSAVPSPNTATHLTTKLPSWERPHFKARPTGEKDCYLIESWRIQRTAQNPNHSLRTLPTAEYIHAQPQVGPRICHRPLAVGDSARQSALRLASAARQQSNILSGVLLPGC